MSTSPLNLTIRTRDSRDDLFDLLLKKGCVFDCGGRLPDEAALCTAGSMLRKELCKQPSYLTFYFNSSVKQRLCPLWWPTHQFRGFEVEATNAIKDDMEGVLGEAYDPKYDKLHWVYSYGILTPSYNLSPRLAFWKWLDPIKVHHLDEVVLLVNIL